MNNKHQKVLASLLANPVNGNIPWCHIEALLLALGCEVVEGNGSSVMFEKGGKRAYFHRPHPQREALKYRVRAVREFLTQLEVKT